MRGFLFKIISKVPLTVLYGLGELCAFLAYHVLGYRKQVVYDNLEMAFPEVSYNDIKKYAKQFYKNFFQVMAELIKASDFDPEDWKSRVSMKNLESVLEYLKNGQSVIMVSGHEANWEWNAYAFPQMVKEQLYFVYKPLKSARMNEALLKSREKHGAIGVPKDSALRSFIKLKKEAIGIGMVADQLPSKGSDKFWVKFLNKQTAFYTGAEKIARLLKYPVFYGRTVRLKKGHYQLEYILIYDGIEEVAEGEITKRFANALNDNIKEHPSDYLWSHRRWKYTPEEVKALTGKEPLFVS